MFPRWREMDRKRPKCGTAWKSLSEFSEGGMCAATAQVGMAEDVRVDTPLNSFNVLPQIADALPPDPFAPESIGCQDAG